MPTWEKVGQIIIRETPVAKKRPRFARVGKGVRAYSEQHTEEGKALLAIQEQWKGPPLLGPVRLQAFFRLPRPKSHFGTGENAGKLKDSAPCWHTKKPDLDNLLKFFKDCANGAIWKDDAQVREVFAIKDYEPGHGVGSTIVNIWEWR